MAHVTKSGSGDRLASVEIVFRDERRVEMFYSNIGKILVSSVGTPHITMAITAIIDCASARLAEPETPFIDRDAIMNASADAAVGCNDEYAYLVALPAALFAETGRGSVGDAFG